MQSQEPQEAPHSRRGAENRRGQENPVAGAFAEFMSKMLPPQVMAIFRDLADTWRNIKDTFSKRSSGSQYTPSFRDARQAPSTQARAESQAPAREQRPAVAQSMPAPAVGAQLTDALSRPLPPLPDDNSQRPRPPLPDNNSQRPLPPLPDDNSQQRLSQSPDGNSPQLPQRRRPVSSPAALPTQGPDSRLSLEPASISTAQRVQLGGMAKAELVRQAPQTRVGAPARPPKKPLGPRDDPKKLKLGL